jgi:hypothetical protein
MKLSETKCPFCKRTKDQKLYNTIKELALKSEEITDKLYRMVEKQ